MNDLSTPAARPLFAFRIGSVPVEVEASFLVMTLVLGAGRDSSVPGIAQWLAVVFVSVLLHEFGHAMAGRWAGLSPSVRLHGWGGLTSFAGSRAVAAGRSLVISLAGPLTGLAVGASFVLAMRLGLIQGAWSVRLAEQIIWVNGGWGLLNLIPVLPYDGGQALRSLLHLLTGRDRLTLVRGISFVTAASLGALAVSAGWIWAAFLLIVSGYQSGQALYQTWRGREDAALEAPLEAAAREALERKAGAPLKAAAGFALARARTDRLRALALHHLALGHLLSGEPTAALDALARLPVGYRPALSLHVEALSAAGRHQEALERLGAATGEELPETAALRAQVEKARARWQRALAQLESPASAPLDALGFAGLRDVARTLGRDADAARAGELLFARVPDADLAIEITRCWARADDAGRAADWLGVAWRSGFRDPGRILSLPELRALDGRAPWEAAKAALGRNA